jgi:hypothetical protein
MRLMAEGPTDSGWLPPRAPGAQPPPRFDMVAPDAVAEPAAAAEPAEAAARPVAPPSFARAAPPPTNGLAVTALVLGVMGLGLLLITAGLGFLFALPCSIGAWLCGAQARTRIALGEATTGRGQAHAGYLLGLAGVVIGVAAAVGWIIWLANGGDLEHLQRDLERWRDAHARQAAVQAALALLGR